MPDFLKSFLTFFIFSILVSAECSAVLKINPHTSTAPSIATITHPSLFSKTRSELRQLKRLMLANVGGYSSNSSSPLPGIASLASTLLSVVFIYSSLVTLLLPFLIFGYVFMAGGIVLGIPALGRRRRLKGFALASLIISGLLLVFSIVILSIMTVPIA